MITFTTENSTYEVDIENHQIRRLSGNKQHTPRQNADGVWTKYESIGPIISGERLLVVWNIKSGKGTLLSEVQSVI